MINSFLPVNINEVRALGWDAVDIVLVTGDAYVDHPSFGVALIGRWLQKHGYRVAILSQPRHHNADDFRQFGAPRLFFGITAGNLDSIVANYSGNARVRDQDAYSPGGNPYFDDTKEKSNRRRPDRATILYANLARQAFGTVPIILGGLEASLRRFVHYDYQQEKIRDSILADAKADLLVYGMGERAVLEIAARLAGKKDLTGIESTCERLTEKEFGARTIADDALMLPAAADIGADRALFMKAELAIDNQARSLAKRPVLQKQKGVWILQNPPADPLTTEELDQLYSLPFCRAVHPASGDVPAYRMICHSITIVRGCSGNCSFCAITRHQGPLVVSRGVQSIVDEAKKVTAMPDFRGTISDLGGPTANLFGTRCKVTSCKKHDCFYPKLCKNLEIDEKIFLELLERCESIAGVKNLFVSSGLRMELLVKTPTLLARLIRKHTPGAMKIAPEHTEENVLRLMHKPGGSLLAAFLDLCRRIAGKEGLNLQFTPYIISAHPGCALADMQKLAAAMKNLGLIVRAPQDFTPTPGTISTAMYVSGLDRETLAPIAVVRNSSERMRQRKTLETQMIRKNDDLLRRPVDRRRKNRIDKSRN